MSSVAQNKSNKGKEFWLGYGYNYGFNNEAPTNSQELVLYLSAEEPATVTVSVAGTAWSTTVSIPANTVNASITVPKTGANDARIFNEGILDKGVHIVSDTPIVVYAHLYNAMVSGATMLMPVESYGYKYYSLNYAQNRSAEYNPGTASGTVQNGPDWYSWFYVIAPENNTRVVITPSDTTRGGWLPGQSYTVNLNKGQIYTVMGKLTAGNNASWAASKDMTGSKIVSIPGADGTCHPVAVFSGSSGIRLCRGDGGEFMQQQVFPTQAWGTRYLTFHTMNNTSTNINDDFKNFYRIGVDDPTTVVKRNGVPLTGLVNNFYYEFVDSTGGDYIEADKPVLVAQYTPGGNRCYNWSQFAYGDPEMFYLSAMEQGKKDVLFYATRKSSIDFNYLNVVLPTAGLSSLTLDGNPFAPVNTKAHPKLPGYSVAVARINGIAAQHRLKSDSNFTATMYGLGFFESYGYNVGTNINNLNYYSHFKNVFNLTTNFDTVTCPKTPLRLFVKLGYNATSIHWKLSQVPGIFPNTDSIITNPVPVATETINGRTYYVYSLQQDFIFTNTGVYTIPISFSSLVIENCSQTENAEIKVDVRPGPVADFITGANTCLNDSVVFTGASSPGIFNITSYRWDFEDNTIANTVNTTKKFTVPGIQNVRYRIYADNGCAGDTTKPINISPVPVSDFGVAGTGCSGDAFVFSDSTTLISGTINTWRWDFGDATVVTETSPVNVSHAYAAPGNYIVSLVTKSANGCSSDTVKKTVTVLQKPVAQFSFDKNICLGDSILFTPVAGANLVQWNWNFGDGPGITKNNSSPFYHPYSSTGIYSVKLNTISVNGCVSDTFALNVTVNNKPAADFSFNGRQCVDSSFNFSSSLAFNPANPANYFWSFGDGEVNNINTSSSASHVYTLPYTSLVVKHVVSFGPGCYSDTISKIIPGIVANPAGDFSMDVNKICEGSPVSFTTAIPVSGLTWNWNFGNGNGNDVPPFTRTYNTAGNFNVTLVVRNGSGCNSLPVSKPLTVTPKPVINAGPDKIISVGGSATLDASIANPSNYVFVWTPAQYLNDASILNPVCTPDENMLYTITATDILTNCTASDEVKVDVVSKLYVPNAFTPNGDGLNDFWQIPGLALYPQAQVNIYNRWGQLIYSINNYTVKPWNGWFKGAVQPNDTYVYLIELKDENKTILKGTVNIIR